MIIAPYFGSKSNTLLRNWITSHFPPSDRYVEICCGLGSVLLGTERHREEILIDKYEPAIALLTELRDNPNGLLGQIDTILAWPRERIKEECTLPNPLGFSGSDRHARFWLHCQTSWCGGGLRWSSGASGESPYLSRAIKTAPRHLLAVSDRLQGVQILHGDGVDWLNRQSIDPDLLVYCDPPYVKSVRKSKDSRHIAGSPRRQYAFDWSDSDHERLASVLNRGFRAIVSGYPSHLYDRLYVGWETVSKRVNGGLEMLWISPTVLVAMPQQSIFQHSIFG